MRLCSHGDIAAVESAGQWSREHLILAKDAGLSPETFLTVRNVHGLIKSGLYGQVGRNDHHAPGRQTERQNGSKAGLSATYWYLKNRLVLTRSEELVCS